MVACKRLIVLILCALSAVPLAAQMDRDNQVEAIVNERVITRFDVFEALGETGARLDELPASDAKREFEKKLQEMILTFLREAAAKSAGVAVAEEDIENSLNKVIEKKGGEEAFRQFLLDRGVSEKRFVEDFRRQQETAAWVRVVAGSGAGVKRLSRELRPLFDLTVTPAEMRSFYKFQKDVVYTSLDRSKVRVIQRYFKPGRREKRRAKTKINSVRLKVEQTKADFALLAKKNSAHPSAEKGGQLELEWIEPDSDLLPKEIVALIFEEKNRKPGTLLGPIENVNSYWLVQVEDVERARVQPFKEVHNDIKRRIQGIKWNRAISTVLLKLVRESYITPRRFKDRLINQLLNQSR